LVEAANRSKGLGIDTSAAAVTAAFAIIVVDADAGVNFDERNVGFLPRSNIAAAVSVSASLFICSNGGEGKPKAVEVKADASALVMAFGN